MLKPDMTLADIAVSRPAATRVFSRHHLDFCCGGKQTVADACTEAGLDTAGLLSEIEREEPGAADLDRWEARPIGELADFVVDRYHSALRRQLPTLVELAAKVEKRHAEKATCPTGLHALLVEMQAEVDAHLMKEEQVLFPMIKLGRGPAVQMPIRVMYQEHDDHGQNLRRIRELTDDLVPPPEACVSWRALYSGLEELERELMEHIHLENNVLFPRALNGDGDLGPQP